VTVRALQIFIFITFRVSRRPREMYCGHARLCVCVSVRGRMPTLLLDPDVTWGSGRGCPLVVHNWANLQSVHRLRCYVVTLCKCVARWQNPAVIRQAHRTPHAWRTRTLCMPAKTPLAGDKIDAPAACAVPFRPFSISGCCNANARC